MELTQRSMDIIDNRPNGRPIPILLVWMELSWNIAMMPIQISLWFQFTTAEINISQAADFGINIMINNPDVATKFNFWGDDNKNQFTSLVTAWVTGTAPSSYTGTIGIANASGVNSAQIY